jgi:hypothetical protein
VADPPPAGAAWSITGAIGEEARLQASQYVPHVDLLVHSMRVSRERLNSRSKIAIDAKLLRLILQNLVSLMPFSEAFYRATYPDLDEAAASGQIPDLHRHFVETGYFEGRLGAVPEVDEAFYLATYPDVASVIQRGEVGSGQEHYERSGASEGRIPSPALQPDIDAWMALLRVSLLAEA